MKRRAFFAAMGIAPLLTLTQPKPRTTEMILRRVTWDGPEWQLEDAR